MKKKVKTSTSLSYLLRQQLQVCPDARKLALELPARVRRRGDAALGGEALQALLIGVVVAEILDVAIIGAGELHDAGSVVCCFFWCPFSRGIVDS